MSRIGVFFIGIKHGAKNFSCVVTDIINFVLLLFVYVVGIGIVSMISKLLGKYFIDLKGTKSSWVIRKLKKGPIEEYYRTF